MRNGDILEFKVENTANKKQYGIFIREGSLATKFCKFIKSTDRSFRSVNNPSDGSTQLGGGVFCLPREILR